MATLAPLLLTWNSKQTDLLDSSDQHSFLFRCQFGVYTQYDETKYTILTKKNVCCINSDINCVKPQILDNLRVQMVKKGAISFQNKDAPFKDIKYQEVIKSLRVEEAMRSETSRKQLDAKRSISSYRFQRKQPGCVYVSV